MVNVIFDSLGLRSGGVVQVKLGDRIKKFLVSCSHRRDFQVWIIQKIYYSSRRNEPK